MTAVSVSLAAITPVSINAMTAAGVMTSLNGWPSCLQPSRRNCDVTTVGATAAVSPDAMTVAVSH